MSKYLLIFLICASSVSAVYPNWVVGGKGDGTDSAATNAGVYDADVTTWAIMQGSKGGFLDTAEGLTVSNNGGGAIRITGGGADLQNAIVGVGIRCDFIQDENTDGIQIITAVNTGNDTVDLGGETFDGDGETVDVVVGGALPNPGDVPDSDDESDGVFIGDGSAHKIWIRALADYTTVDESDSILYVNEAGTESVPIIWECHFAEISSETGDFGIVTFNANTITNAIETAVGGSVYHTFIGFSLENATDDGANLNGTTDGHVRFIRCQFTSNGAWGIQGGTTVYAVFCDLDGNMSGGININGSNIIIGSVVRNNTNAGILAPGNAQIDNCLVFDNQDGGTGKTQISVSANPFAAPVIIGCTIDGNDGTGSIGIAQLGATPAEWLAINNIITDCVTGISDAGTIRQTAILYNNLYNSNTNDTSNISPVPVDGDIWGNIVDPTNLFSSGYILHADNKGKGIDASYTQAYWDDFNGGAGDNPPAPLSGLSFMDMGSLQREEAGGGGGGQPVLGGSVVR